MKQQDVRAHNRAAWDKNMENGNPWTIPVSPETVAAARRGEWEIILTPTKPIPKDWFPKLLGCDVLCFACGGGQQGPILAAAGANVTVFDNSPKQLGQDRLVAERDGLPIRTVEGDMEDLSVFSDESFDLIVNPVSLCFTPNVRTVWKEAYRVLRRGGIILSGFPNPFSYLFDPVLEKQGILQVRFALPYSELSSISEEERASHYGKDAPLEFSHILEDLIGGQLGAGFVITGFYEDTFPGELISNYAPSYIATRAVKPRVQTGRSVQ